MSGRVGSVGMRCRRDAQCGFRVAQAHPDHLRRLLPAILSSARHLCSLRCVASCCFQWDLEVHEPVHHKQRKEMKPRVKNKTTLFEAEKLLDEIIDALVVAHVSPRSQGSSRLLLVRLQRLRDLLGELDHYDPGWTHVVAGVVLREAVGWVAEMINNIHCLFSSHRCEYGSLDRATWIRA